jgi:RNA polymerase sigma factor (sigma-70 family)
LLRAFATRNDQEAFAVLVKRHGPLVLDICRRVLRQLQDAEDAFQATFIVLARQAAALAKKDGLAGWLHRVSYRIALSARRAAQRRAKHERQAATMSPTNPAWETAWREVQLLLDEEVQRLPDKYREPFILCCLGGQSCAAAARELGIKEGTIWSRLAEARKRLQSRLSRRGIELTAVLGAATLAANRGLATVPIRLVGRTVELSVAAAATKALPAGVVSEPIAALINGMTRSFLLQQTKLAVVLALVSALVGVTGLGAQKAPVPQGTAANGNLERSFASWKQAGDAGDAVRKEQGHAIDAFGDPLPDGAIARLGTVRFRHHGNGSALLYTPDGKTLVGRTGSGIVMWEAATGKVLQRLPGPFHSLFFHDEAGGTDDSGGMDISPDGAKLAFSDYGPGEQPKVTLLTLATGESRTLALPDAKGANNAGACFIRLSFTRDGKTLVWGDAANGRVVIIDVASGAFQSSLGGRDSVALYNFAVSPDGKTLAAAVCSSNRKTPGKAHAVQVWDLATRTVLRTLRHLPDKNAEKFVGKLAFTSDGGILAFGVKDEIHLCDSATGKPLGSLESQMGQINNLAFTPDGKTLVSGSAGGKTRIWDLTTRSLRHTCDSGYCGVISPSGDAVALFDSNVVRVWDVATCKERFPEYQGHVSGLYHVAFSPDGKRLVSSPYSGPIFLWEMAVKPRKVVLPWEGRALCFSPDGTLLVTSPSGDWPRNEVRVWDVARQMQALQIKVPDADHVTAAAFSRDGRKLFTSGSTRAQSYLHRWDVATGRVERPWKPTLKPNGEMLLSPDGSLLFGVLEDGRAFVYDPELGGSQFFRGPSDESNCGVALAPDSRVLACGETGVRLWELLTGKDILLLKGNKGAGGGLAWSPDGTLVASGDRQTLNVHNYGLAPGRSMSWMSVGRNPDPTIRVWNAATGKEVACFAGFHADVHALSFSPDGKLLAAGLGDSTVLLLDVAQLGVTAGNTFKVAGDFLGSCWSDLRSPNAATAHRAIGMLVANPKDSVLFLKKQVKPVEPTDRRKIDKWVGDLNSDVFAVRQAATKELQGAGEQAKAAVRNALQSEIPLETRRRLEQILNVLTDAPSPDVVRNVRAIMALERIGAPEAELVLKALAQGASGARESKEAKASVDRLAQRASRLR